MMYAELANSMNMMSEGVQFEEFKTQMESYPPDPYISITYLHSQTLPDELKRNADSLIPR